MEIWNIQFGTQLLNTIIHALGVTTLVVLVLGGIITLLCYIIKKTWKVMACLAGLALFIHFFMIWYR